MKKKTVLIIGAGPAGLAAAIELAKTGFDVTVIDQNKPGQINDKGETKLCGGGLIPAAQKFLKDYCLKGLPNDTWVMRDNNNIARMNLGYTAVLNIDRVDLANKMAEKAKKAGAGVVYQTRVTNIDFQNKQAKTKNKIYPYDFLIGADGFFSVVKKELVSKGIINKDDRYLQAVEYKISKDAIPPTLLMLDFERKFFSAGYGWIFPHTNCYSIGACESHRSRLKKEKPLRNDLLAWAKQRKLPVSNIKINGWCIPYGYQGHSFPNEVYLAGDAAGFAGGLLGDGIAQALYSGYDIARLIIDPNYNPKNIKNILRVKRRQEFFILAHRRIKWLKPQVLKFLILLSKCRITKGIPAHFTHLAKTRSTGF